MPSSDITHVDNVYIIVHLNTNSEQKTKIVQLKNDVTIQYLIGYDNKFLIEKYNLHEGGNVVHEKSINFINSIENFNQSHPLCKITAYKFENKYIITDGKHRASTLYFRGDRHLFITSDVAPCENINNLLELNQERSHLDNFNGLIYHLNNKNIRFVVIRGFRTMPKTPDTDLDVIIHPDDYNIFLETIKPLLDAGTISFNVEKKYSHHKELWYRAYRTNGIYNDFLSNKNYQIDTYNNVFFFASEKDGTILSEEFLDFLFKNKQKFNNIFIPNNLSEMVLLFCRTHFDLKGKWKDKHKNRFDQLKLNVSENDFISLLRKSLEPNFHHLIHFVPELFE